MHFIPILRKSNRGHFVTIQSNEYDAEAYVKSTSEISKLIKHNDGGQNELKLSTIIYQKRKTTNNYFKNLSILDLSLCEIANSIIVGIEKNRKFVNVNDQRSLINLIFNMIKIKCT